MMSFVFFAVRSVKTFTTSKQQFNTVHRSLLDVSNITFRLRAAENAKVLLLSTVDNTRAPSYEVVIGMDGNTKTVLRVQSVIGEIVAEQETINILSSGELRPFWIRWTNGMLNFGTGSIVGSNTVISIVDPQKQDIHSLAVSSDSGSTAEWEFGDIYDTG